MNTIAHTPFVTIGRALIAYDNDVQRSYIGKLLQRLGVRSIAGSATAEEFIARVRESPFDLFVASARMPGMSVLQLIDTLAEQCRGGHVIVSGLSDRRIENAIVEYAQQRTHGQVVPIFAGEPLRLFDFTDMLHRAISPRTVDGKGSSYDEATPHLTADDVLRAYRAGEMAVFLQPEYCLTSGSLTGAELLVRWRHPTLGLLRPDRFLAMLEESDLGPELVDQVIDLAVATSLSLNLPRPIKYSINIPGPLIASASWADTVVRRIRQAGGATSSIAIEVTEHVSSVHDANVAGAVAHWRLNGIDCAIDDFGGGASSLHRLCMAPFNVLKIDQQMVWRARAAEHALYALRSLVELAHELGMRVIAEGIETQEDLERMASIKCDLGQGYFFSPALPDKEFQALAYAAAARRG